MILKMSFTPNGKKTGAYISQRNDIPPFGGRHDQESYDLADNTIPITGLRFWEIDFFRGLAVILMLGLHFLVDLYLLFGYQSGISLFFWNVWQKVTASTFIILVGISLTFKSARCGLFRKLFQRGLVIFGWGIIITIVTKMFLKEGFIFYVF